MQLACFERGPVLDYPSVLRSARAQSHREVLKKCALAGGGEHQTAKVYARALAAASAKLQRRARAAKSVANLAVGNTALIDLALAREAHLRCVAMRLAALGVHNRSVQTKKNMTRRALDAA
jgi:hypothetical protein